MPGPPRPLNSVDKDKYALQACLDLNGQVKEHKQTEAYEQYYSVKFKRMCEKQAVGMYKDYLARVKSDYETKKQAIFSNKSQFTNFSQQILCLPVKSRVKVNKLIEQRHAHKGTEINQRPRRDLRQNPTSKKAAGFAHSGESTQAKQSLDPT